MKSLRLSDNATAKCVYQTGRSVYQFENLMHCVLSRFGQHCASFDLKMRNARRLEERPLGEAVGHDYYASAHAESAAVLIG